METRVAVMGIIVEDTNAVNLLNEILHEYSEYIIGRMGIPYKQKTYKRNFNCVRCPTKYNCLLWQVN